jgi:hypothetical protein
MTDQRKPKLSDALVEVLSGISAGIVASFVSHPLDTVKLGYNLIKHHI